MRIAIMLRHFEQHEGGVMEYTKRLLNEFFSTYQNHEYLLLYKNHGDTGTFGKHENVREIVCESRSRLVWDQFVVPRVVHAEQADIVFNPKYSLPLTIHCPGVFVCHGLDWYVMPWGSKWMDRLSHKYLIPQYAHKASAILAVSNSTKEHVTQYLGVDPSRVITVYHGVDDSFHEPVSEEKVRQVSAQYNLRKSFYLYVSRIYPAKNFGRLIRAFAKIGPKNGRHLVIAGTHTEGCEDELALIDALGIDDWVMQLGWVEREYLPALYSLADALVQPSLYESFGISLVEAMSVGCPVLTSNRYGAAEIVGDAGVLVDPDNVDDIANGMMRIVDDDLLRADIIEKGLERSSLFHWKVCATQTMQALEQVYEDAR